MQERWVKVRIGLTAVVMVGVLLSQAGWLAHIQLGNHSRVSRVWEAQLLAPRGGIYDRGGLENPLAISLPGRRVFLDPKTVDAGHDRLHIASTVADALDIDTDVVLAGLSRTDTSYVPLGVVVNENVIDALRTEGISGVHWTDEMVRHYPLGSKMAHVIGFVNAEGIGSAGIEQRFNEYLIGSPGFIVSKLDARRREIYRERNRRVAPIAGAGVVLTVDQNVQHAVEQALDDVVRAFNASGAWAIVQRVSTGEILAMAARPDYDPNRYRETTRDLWRNRAISDVFEPGSTMKTLVVAAALNEGLITPDSVIDCGNGNWFYGGHNLRDRVRGEVTVEDIIRRSSNVGAAKIGLMLGNRRLEAYLRAFGFGSRLGIDLPGEEMGLLAPASRWSTVTPTRLSIGQGLAATALQMLGLYCTLANDGVAMRPYIVRQVIADNGEVIYKGRPEVIGRPVRPATAAQTRRMLIRVTEPGGTATRAAIPRYSVAGKTGTAQIPVDGRYSNTEYWASFVGVLPADRPEIGIIVVVERPTPQHTGGYVAAPVFGRIGETVAHYLEIAPSGENVPPATGVRIDHLALAGPSGGHDGGVP